MIILYRTYRTRGGSLFGNNKQRAALSLLLKKYLAQNSCGQYNCRGEICSIQDACFVSIYQFLYICNEVIADNE